MENEMLTLYFKVVHLSFYKMNIETHIKKYMHSK
jgi:hypothetical protein